MTLECLTRKSNGSPGEATPTGAWFSGSCTLRKCCKFLKKVRDASVSMRLTSARWTSPLECGGPEDLRTRFPSRGCGID